VSAHASTSPVRAISSVSRPRAWLIGAAALLVLVASLSTSASASAAVCANAKYRTGPSLFLPECRAYEMLTPQGKTNLLKTLNANAPDATFTADGEGFLYRTVTGPLASDASAGIPTWERTRRTATGWKVESATPPILSPYVETGNGSPRAVVASANLDKIFFTASGVYDPDQYFSGASIDNGGVHLSDGKSNTWISKPTWAGALPQQGEPAAGASKFTPLGGSPDLSTVYFNSFGTLTPEDGTSGRTALDSTAVYKWENGELSNAGVLPDGSLSPGGSISPDRVGQSPLVGMSAGDVDATLHHPVSKDGKSLLFLSPDPARAKVEPSLPKPQLYMAVDGKPSVLISAPEGDTEPAAGTVGVAPTSDRMGGSNIPTSAYAVATPDHSVVLFSTADALTEDAEENEVVKTYRYEAADGSLTYLPDLDRVIIGTPGSSESNEKYGQIVELSESGDSMLYRTEADLLRLWRKGKPTLTVSADVKGKLGAEVTYITSARFSANEEVLALSSTGPLRGEVNHLPTIGNQVKSQVYRYTVADDQLECISCKPGGSLTGAVLSIAGPENGYATGSSTAGGFWSNRSMTSDGSTIYFTTKTALVEADHNTADDVYQWQNGQLTLFSTGVSGADGAQLYGVTPSGRDVFIVATDRLVEADTDEVYDIYDVRVGGGFDPPQPPPAPCAADECQGPPAPISALPGMGSAAVNGRGNASEGRRARVRASGFRASAARSATGKATVVRVHAPGAGRMVVNGRLVKKAARSVSKAGTYQVRASLTGSAAVKLSREGTLKVGLRVSFSPESGPPTTRSVQVTFKQPGAKSSRAANSRKGQ
jgi:hypothetical protein